MLRENLCSSGAKTLFSRKRAHFLVLEWGSGGGYYTHFLAQRSQGIHFSKFEHLVHPFSTFLGHHNQTLLNFPMGFQNCTHTNRDIYRSKQWRWKPSIPTDSAQSELSETNIFVRITSLFFFPRWTEVKKMRSQKHTRCYKFLTSEWIFDSRFEIYVKSWALGEIFKPVQDFCGGHLECRNPIARFRSAGA